MKKLVLCEQKHRHFLWISRVKGMGPTGEFATGETVLPVPKESYAYTHGGCCYRAAVDLLHAVKEQQACREVPTETTTPPNWPFRNITAQELQEAKLVTENRD